MKITFINFSRHAIASCFFLPVFGCVQSDAHDSQSGTDIPAVVDRTGNIPPALPVAEKTNGADIVRLQNCKNELDAMYGLDGGGYGHYKTSFDAIMASAASYAGVRSQVKDDTVNAIDALYDYKTRRVCSEIHQALLLRLADAAEKVK